MTESGADLLRQVALKDGRYPVEAYRFIFEALGYSLQQAGRSGGHVTGRELAEGIRGKALAEFGGLARVVFETWGIRRTEDFGEIVFNLVESGLMGKTDTDSKEDFNGVYDFREAFPTIDEMRRRGRGKPAG